MEMLKQHKSMLPLTVKCRGSKYIDLIVILLMLFGQVAAQDKTDRVAKLIDQLKSPDEYVRSRAAYELGWIRPEAKQAIPALIVALKDESNDVRSSVAEALGRIGPEAKQAIPALIVALKDESNVVRSSAAYALGRMGLEAKQAIPALIVALKDESNDVRNNAARALGRMGLEAKQAVPDLIEALKDKDEDVRSSAADALGRIGPEAKQAVPALIEALKDESKYVRSSAAETLSSIAKALFDTKDTESLPQLKTAYGVLQTYPDLKNEAADVKRTIDYFESLWWVKLWDSVERLVRANPLISLLLAAYLVLQLVWLLFFWLRPLLLLKVITSLGQVGERFKIPWLNITIPFRPLLVFPLFYYRSRLLDAWVRSNLLAARENFANKQTVSQRKVYVAMPASINETTCDSVSATSFQPISNKSKLTILVAGEGGAGKTSLACRMALWAMKDEPHERLCKPHRMLPVLIESNLEARPDGKNALVETAHGQLGDLIGLTEPIPKELFDKLLRKRRVLVILDSLSELDETTHMSVRPAQSDFPIAALIVTSRIDEELGGAMKTTVRPLRLKSNSLSTFLHEYLTRCGKRGLFEDDEFFDDCRRLSQIVGEREITMLIARLYADQMIAAKERTSDHELPRNLPDLMQGYVKNLNDKVKADKLDTGALLRAAKIIAAKCLAQTYRPSPARIDEVLKALSTETDAKALLKYLEDRIQIIQTTGAAGDRIRYSLDPLAEYLTGLYLVENYNNQEHLWQGFIDTAKDQPGAPEAIKGFLLAVRDCCVDKGGDYGVPERIKDELARLASLDPEEVNAAHLKQRIRRLIANLKLPDAEDRATAARSLGRIGSEAKSAVPALIEAYKDENADVRLSAAYALELMRQDAKETTPSLSDALKDQSEEENV
ncbi:MAG TPA: HEAT repeat domain-containing protein [Blastocatellia bacterium]|nr:HEAT repeat domain-containing protein [Blastocatellia bacterium]